LNSELWLRIKPILDHTLDLDPADRSRYVQSACEGDEDLEREIGQYLALEPELGDFITDPVVDLHEWSLDAADLIGCAVGPYIIREEIGRGGIGIVYLAERSDGEFDRRVAVKVLKRGLETEELVRRFHLERRILARLEHPNIASLLDAGSLPDGRPYLVMQFVDGEPIDRWCLTRELSIEARIELFLAVCDAVQFAHQRLVIHRDLKPGNILVTPDGLPKLLDFGIARLVDPTHLHLASIYPLRMMTLEYASPEQVAGGAVTTASDVYSLGVLLFHLLTGRSPYRTPSGDRSGLEREVRLASPPRLETSVAPSDETAAVSGITLHQLKRRLRGDLETIVTKALQKEAERRYGSPEQLADDLRRHLGGLPVLARPDSLGYRVGKFIRRHKIAVTAAALAFGLVGTFGAVTYSSLQVSDRERQKSERVRDFLVEIFEKADPGKARGEAITARDLLDQGIARIDEHLRDDPEALAELLETLGRVRRNLGNLESSRVLLQRALELNVGIHGNPSRPVTRTKHNLGLTLIKLGRLDEAEALIANALASQRALGSTDSDPEYLKGLNNLGGIYENRGNFVEAERILAEVVTQKRRAGVDPLEVASSLNNLARARYNLQDYDGAEPLYRESLEIRVAHFGVEKPSPEVARAMNNLAALLEDVGKVEEASGLYEQALEMRRQLFPDGHREVVVSLNNLALLRQKQGRLEEAARLLAEAVVMPALRSLSGAEQANILGHLADVRLAARDPACGASAQEALDLLRSLESSEPEKVIKAERLLGECAALAGLGPSIPPSTLVR
jgi:eukaryotic-like serine/threonine-protein kinase